MIFTLTQCHVTPLQNSFTILSARGSRTVYHLQTVHRAHWFCFKSAGSSPYSCAGSAPLVHAMNQFVHGSDIKSSSQVASRYQMTLPAQEPVLLSRFPYLRGTQPSNLSPAARGFCLLVLKWEDSLALLQLRQVHSAGEQSLVVLHLGKKEMKFVRRKLSHFRRLDCVLKSSTASSLSTCTEKEFPSHQRSRKHVMGHPTTIKGMTQNIRLHWRQCEHVLRKWGARKRTTTKRLTPSCSKRRTVYYTD